MDGRRQATLSGGGPELLHSGTWISQPLPLSAFALKKWFLLSWEGDSWGQLFLRVKITLLRAGCSCQAQSTNSCFSKKLFQNQYLPPHRTAKFGILTLSFYFLLHVLSPSTTSSSGDADLPFVFPQLLFSSIWNMPTLSCFMTFSRPRRH